MQMTRAAQCDAASNDATPDGSAASGGIAARAAEDLEMLPANRAMSSIRQASHDSLAAGHCRQVPPPAGNLGSSKRVQMRRNPPWPAGLESRLRVTPHRIAQSTLSHVLMPPMDRTEACAAGSALVRGAARVRPALALLSGGPMRAQRRDGEPRISHHHGAFPCPTRNWRPPWSYRSNN